MTGSSHWRRDIQGLRALAIIVVVLFHAGLPVPGGFIGVDVFFVISGYAITGMLRRDWQRDGRTQYLDGGHISVEESAALAPRFIATLRR